MCEAIDDGIAVVITATAIPAVIDTRVWGKLYHAERKRSAGKGVSMTAGTDEGVYVGSEGGLGEGCSWIIEKKGNQKNL